MKIEVYLDDDSKPYKVIEPPEKIKVNSKEISDGRHRLRFCAIEKDGVTSEREVEFIVSNGPSIALHGIRNNDVVSGEVSILANAYSSRIGDEFEPVRIETPLPIPTWAWVLCLIIFSWAVGYLTWEYGARESLIGDSSISSGINSSKSSSSDNKVQSSKNDSSDVSALGEQVYGNYCASCHQSNGEGLPGVFPALKNSEVVLADDASEHIDIVLNGLKDKEIAGVKYAAPMPGFGAQLTNEEVAAVVNHERSSWGNNALKVNHEIVAAER